MKKSISLLTTVLMLMLVLGGMSATAQPKLHQYSFSDGSIVQRLSDNGQWGVAQACMSDAIESGQAKLINMATDEYFPLQTQADVVASGAAQAKDVTNDGSIVVGQYKGQPAYWSKSTGKWTILPLPQGCSGGCVLTVTPDGKYAVGSGNYALNEYQEKGAMWDLTENKVVDLPNTPVLDMTHERQNQMRFTDISPDGRYIVMYMSFSYIQPASLCVWVYDRETSKPTAIGFTPSDTDRWTPLAENLYWIEEPAMSPNGKWVVVTARVTGTTIGSDHEYPARYNVETGEFTLYTEAESDGMIGNAIDNEGHIYGATPSSSPIRNWYVRYGDYWFDINNILTQHYNFNLNGKTGYENTGTVFSISEDGKRMAVMCDPQYGEGYVLDVPEKLTELCKTINLLGNYTISPASGSTFSNIREISLLFDRKVETVITNPKDIKLIKADDGSVTREASGFQVSATDEQKVIITFRNATLEAGKKYTVEIPEGAIAIKGDKARTNNAIKLEYTGRANRAVAPTVIYPADNSELARIDNSNNPVLITFDSEIVTSETAEAELINLSDGAATKLNIMASGNRIAVFPASIQYLYKGLKYQLIVKKGAVTDVTGNGGNEEIVINYTGTYEPEVSQDDENVFIETFDNTSAAYNNLMRYEGDHNTPDAKMKEWEFDADNQPWNFSIRDTEASTDVAAASTSMYDPAGKSNDWMSTHQLYLPDNFCYLSFKAQSYKMRKKDYLKVIVLQSDSAMYSLNADAIKKFETEGKVVFNEQLNPGLSEEELAGDWTDYRVDLAEYGGKNIYVAFVNENENQSVVFVDSIVVKRNLKFLISLTHIQSMVSKESAEIKGRITANDDAATFTSIKLELSDANGNKVDEISADGLSLKKGDKYEFTFTKQLPLTVGVENEFTIKVTMNDYSSEVKSTIKNLAFTPTKRVVLEEMTGTTCVNCPRGILAIENLEKLYHEQFIPISLHTYTGDALNTGQDGYCSFLGLSAAPSGIVQRNGIISNPMGEDFYTFEPTFSNGFNLWADYVAKEFQTPADADINATVTVDEANNTYSVPVSVKYALNAKNLNLNLFLVILEDGIISFQQNNLGSMADPIFGEWGKGGRYSDAVNYNVTHKDVVRSNMSSYNGFGGYLPQTVEAGKEYTATLGAYDVPGTIQDIDKAKAVVMLIDANDGRLINAVCAKFPGYTSGINDIVIDNTRKNDIVYSLDGRMIGTDIKALPKGVYIMNGKKYVNK